MNKTDPPATNKCLFYIWDFVQRTRFNLNNIDIGKLDANDPAAVEEYKDALGRCLLSHVLISDRSDQYVERICGDPPIDFGPDARAKSAALKPGRPAVV